MSSSSGERAAALHGADSVCEFEVAIGPNPPDDGELGKEFGGVFKVF